MSKETPLFLSVGWVIPDLFRADAWLSLGVLAAGILLYMIINTKEHLSEPHRR